MPRYKTTLNNKVILPGDAGYERCYPTGISRISHFNPDVLPLKKKKKCIYIYQYNEHGTCVKVERQELQLLAVTICTKLNSKNYFTAYSHLLSVFASTFAGTHLRRYQELPQLRQSLSFPTLL